MDIDLQALAREIAARMDPDAWLDANDVGALMKYEARYVTDVLVHEPGFPKAIRRRTKDGRRGQLRWPRRAILAHMEAIARGANPKGGRPRLHDSEDF
jgi:hypothetical protein